MAINGVSASPKVLQQQPTDNPVKASFGGKISDFFRAVATGVQSAFTSFGNAVTGLFARGADASAAKTTPGVYSAREKKEMLAAFRAGDLYREVKSGEKIDKNLLESGAERILANKEALTKMKDHGLTLSEAVSIFIYTTGAYTEINNQLRAGSLSEDVDAVTKQCVEGLRKLPSHSEQVTRLVELPPEILQQHSAGAERGYEAFTSTSANPNGADEFVSNTLMMIKPKDGSAGKDVSMFSNSPGEEEVLFPPGTRFKIIGRTEAKERTALDLMMDLNRTPHLNKTNLVMAEI